MKKKTQNNEDNVEKWMLRNLFPANYHWWSRLEMIIVFWCVVCNLTRRNHTSHVKLTEFVCILLLTVFIQFLLFIIVWFKRFDFSFLVIYVTELWRQFEILVQFHQDVLNYFLIKIHNKKKICRKKKTKILPIFSFMGLEIN